MSVGNNLINLIPEENKIKVEYLTEKISEDKYEELLNQAINLSDNPQQAANILSKIILNMAYNEIKDIIDIVNSINGIKLSIDIYENKIVFVIEYSNDEKLEKFAKLLAIVIATLPQWINAKFQAETENLLNKISNEQ